MQRWMYWLVGAILGISLIAAQTSSLSATSTALVIDYIKADCNGSDAVAFHGTNPGFQLRLFDQHLGQGNGFVQSDPLIFFNIPAGSNSPQNYSLDLSNWTGGPHYRVDAFDKDGNDTLHTKSVSLLCYNNPTSTPTATNTREPSPTPSNTPIPTQTPSPTSTNTAIPSATATNTKDPSPTPTNTQVPSQTPTETATNTAVPPSETPTSTEQPSLTPTSTENPTETATSTPQDTPTATETQNSTPTPTATISDSPTPENTAISSPTLTPSSTQGASPTPTSTPEATSTPTGTQNPSQTPTETTTPGETPTPTETGTTPPPQTGTPTETVTPTEVPFQPPTGLANCDGAIVTNNSRSGISAIVYLNGTEKWRGDIGVFQIVGIGWNEILSVVGTATADWTDSHGHSGSIGLGSFGPCVEFPSPTPAVKVSNEGSAPDVYSEPIGQIKYPALDLVIPISHGSVWGDGTFHHALKVAGAVTDNDFGIHQSFAPALYQARSGDRLTINGEKYKVAQVVVVLGKDDRVMQQLLDGWTTITTCTPNGWYDNLVILLQPVVSIRSFMEMK